MVPKTEFPGKNHLQLSQTPPFLFSRGHEELARWKQALDRVARSRHMMGMMNSAVEVRMRPRHSTLLFVHIPKTAGTTLKTILEKQYSANDRCELYSGLPSTDGNPWILASQSRPRAIIGHFHYGLHSRPEVRPILEDDFQYATFLRDPVARVVSQFNHVMNSDDPLHREIFAKHPTLERFLQHGWARNVQTQTLTDWCSDQIEREPDSAVRVAIDIMRDHFRVVGVTERFDESLILFAQAFGWRLPMYVPVNLATSRTRRLRVKDLDDLLIARIRDANRCDISIYEHAVSVLGRRLSEDFWLRMKLRGYQSRLAVYQFLRRQGATLKGLFGRGLCAAWPSQRRIGSSS